MTVPFYSAFLAPGDVGLVFHIADGTDSCGKFLMMEL